MQYRNGNESNYFGSDLNKFVNKYCSKEMTAVNIDLLMFKRSKRKIRLIESKHGKENFQSGQWELLKLFAKFCNVAGYDFDVFIVRGDPPYNECVVTNMLTGKKYFIKSAKELRNWLEFNLELS